MAGNVLNHLQKLQEIPNVPFLVKPIKAYLEGVIKKNGYKYSTNDYSIIVNTNKNPSKPKLIIMAHSDHPGIIIKNKKNGIAMGTLETDRLRKILSKNKIELKIFDPNGKFLGIGDLIGIHKNSRDVYLDINFDVPSNSFGQYNLKYFESNLKFISAYSLDDTISVAIMLSLLENKLESKYDVYYVFNLYEEVHQISAWYLAKHNVLNINKNDIIINLESQKVENIDDNSYPPANYENGPILQLSNTGCLFGYKVEGDNQSEKIARHIAKKDGIKLQIGLTKDSDDSRPFSYFPLTSNIISLNIPNKYKHNCGPNGEVIPEVIYIKDVEDITKLVIIIIQGDNNSKDEMSLSRKVKKRDTITKLDLMRKKAQLNNRLDISYKSVIKRGYYYPLNILDFLSDILCKIGFYLIFYFQKVRMVIGHTVI